MNLQQTLTAAAFVVGAAMSTGCPKQGPISPVNLFTVSPEDLAAQCEPVEGRKVTPNAIGTEARAIEKAVNAALAPKTEPEMLRMQAQEILDALRKNVGEKYITSLSVDVKAWGEVDLTDATVTTKELAKLRKTSDGMTQALSYYGDIIDSQTGKMKDLTPDAQRSATLQVRMGIANTADSPLACPDWVQEFVVEKRSFPVYGINDAPVPVDLTGTPVPAAEEAGEIAQTTAMAILRENFVDELRKAETSLALLKAAEETVNAFALKYIPASESAKK